MSIRIVPTYEQPVSRKDQTTASWYRFFQDMHLGTPPGPEMSIVVGASPFIYTAPSGGFVIITGGTVTAVQFIRTITTLTGLTTGIFPVSAADQLVVTYAALPNMLFVPQ